MKNCTKRAVGPMHECFAVHGPLNKSPSVDKLQPAIAPRSRSHCRTYCGGSSCDTSMTLTGHGHVMGLSSICCAGMVHKAGAANHVHRVARQCVLREVQSHHCARDRSRVCRPQCPSVRPAEVFVPCPYLQRYALRLCLLSLNTFMMWFAEECGITVSIA